MESKEVDNPTTSDKAVADLLTALRAAYQHPQMALSSDSCIEKLSQ